MAKTDGQKLVDKFGSVNTLTRNGFVNVDGTCVHSALGVQHRISCSLAKVSLEHYARRGGLRVMIYRNQLTLEHVEELTEDQMKSVARMVRKNVFNILTVNGRVFDFDVPITPKRMLTILRNFENL